MATLELRGRITQEGDLEVKLPAGLPSGEVTVRIDLPNNDTEWESLPWTQQELDELMKPMSREEFIAWLDANPPQEAWGDMSENDDPAEYVHRMRRQTRFTLDE